MTMTCRHNWHFTGLSTLVCKRCAAELGPRPYEQMVQELTQEPRAWFTIAELNEWADKYLAKHKEKQNGH